MTIESRCNISVIIPTCDRPLEYLNAALDSALGQTLQPLEIIVVDNGRRPVDPVALSQGIALYRLPYGVGVSRARNLGAAMARGSHLAFLDDDDLWDAGFLREAWAVLTRENGRCVYGRKDLLDDGVRKPYKTPNTKTMTVPVLLEGNPGTGGINLLIERLLFWQVSGFDPNLRISEDRALALEVLLAGERICVAPKAAALMRSHSGDRLRHYDLRKIRFIWKYRKHTTYFVTAVRIMRLLLKALLRRSNS